VNEGSAYAVENYVNKPTSHTKTMGDTGVHRDTGDFAHLTRKADRRSESLEACGVGEGRESPSLFEGR
jgi:hypothetical protein